MNQLLIALGLIPVLVLVHTAGVSVGNLIVHLLTRKEGNKMNRP